MPKPSFWDVIVVGGGNAGCAAATSAARAGSSVLLIDKLPRAEFGGNSRFTRNIRFPHLGGSDLVMRYPKAFSPSAVSALMGVPAYTEEMMFADWMMCSDPTLVDSSLVRSIISAGEEVVETLVNVVGHRFVASGSALPGALPIDHHGGGATFMERWRSCVLRHGVAIRDQHQVMHIDQEGSMWALTVESPHEIMTMYAQSVVLASGGFEASPALRKVHLGSAWEEIRVRGSQANDGHLLATAIERGAGSRGDWQGAHAPLLAPKEDPMQKWMGIDEQRYCHPFGVTVGAEGTPLFDERAMPANKSYATLGRICLENSGNAGGRALQIFSSLVAEAGLLSKSYLARGDFQTFASPADLIGSRRRPRELQRLRADVFMREAVPRIYDNARFALETAQTAAGICEIERSPIICVPVEPGITFTYGGLHTTEGGVVRSDNGGPMLGLCAAGEIVGGLFGPGYLGGSGLYSGLVIGTRAGRSAHDAARTA